MVRVLRPQSTRVPGAGALPPPLTNAAMRLSLLTTGGRLGSMPRPPSWSGKAVVHRKPTAAPLACILCTAPCLGSPCLPFTPHWLDPGGAGLHLLTRMQASWPKSRCGTEKPSPGLFQQRPALHHDATHRPPLQAWYKYGLEDQMIVRQVPSVLLEVVVLAAYWSLKHDRPLPELIDVEPLLACSSGWVRCCIATRGVRCTAGSPRRLSRSGRVPRLRAVRGAFYLMKR
jgi:hypothetical protein